MLGSNAWQDRFWKPSYFDALAVVKGKAEAEGVTLVEAALRWLYHHSALRSDDGVRPPRDPARSFCLAAIKKSLSSMSHHDSITSLQRDLKESLLLADSIDRVPR